MSLPLYLSWVSGFCIQSVVYIFLFVPSLSPKHSFHLSTRCAVLPDSPLLGSNIITWETQKLSVILDTFLSPVTFNQSPSCPPTSNINSSSEIFLEFICFQPSILKLSYILSLKSLDCCYLLFLFSNTHILNSILPTLSDWLFFCFILHSNEAYCIFIMEFYVVPLFIWSPCSKKTVLRLLT